METSSTEEQVVQEPSLEDKAAHDFKLMLPEFFKLVDTMPKKQLVRVFHAIMEYPLETQYPKLSFESERKAFYLGMQLQESKFILMNAVMKIMQDKEAAAKLKNDIEQLEVSK